MRATLMYKAGDVRIEHVPDPKLLETTDAILRITRACICGSDLWPYKLLKPVDNGQRMGHEAIGVVEEVGAGVRTLKAGDSVIMPFAFSDGTCAFCREGLHTSCVHGGFFGVGGKTDGAQAEALRVPQADGTLFRLPVRADEALMPALLTRALTGGFGAHSVLECVGSEQAIRTALGIVRAGGHIGRVGLPNYEAIPALQPFFYRNITVAGGPAPVRAYISELLPDVLEGRIPAGRVFDRTVGLEGVPAAYRAMDRREALKVMVQP